MPASCGFESRHLPALPVLSVCSCACSAFPPHIKWNYDTLLIYMGKLSLYLSNHALCEGHKGWGSQSRVSQHAASLELGVQPIGASNWLIVGALCPGLEVIQGVPYPVLSGIGGSKMDEWKHRLSTVFLGRAAILLPTCERETVYLGLSNAGQLRQKKLGRSR